MQTLCSCIRFAFFVYSLTKPLCTWDMFLISFPCHAQSQKAVEHGSEDEAAHLLEEIKALNHKIAAHTAADTAQKARKHLERVTTVREALWKRLVDEKREEWMARSADAGAARACNSVREWGAAAESMCRDSQFELQQQGLEALVAHRDWSEATMKRTSWRG